MNPNRRSIQYHTFDEINADVDRLIRGHSTVGAWTLGQICDHLATVAKRWVDMPASTQHDPSMRVTDERKREIFATGQLPEGLTMPATLATPNAVDATEGASRLRKALAYFHDSPTPAAEHARFGPLTRDEWDRVVCIHCAHHLSFAIPKAGV